MKLLFDLMALQPSQGKFHGGGEYARTLLYALIERKSKKDIVEAFYQKDKWIDDNVLNDCKKAGIVLHQIEKFKDISVLVNAGGYDKFYSALPYRYDSLKMSSGIFSLTIHGLRDLEMPTDRLELHYTRGFIKYAKVLIKQWFPEIYRNRIINGYTKLVHGKNCEMFVPSQHTKFAMAALLGVSPEKMHVCYSPRKLECNAEIHPHDTRLQTLDGRLENFILIVSADRWIKNSIRALEAIQKYLSGRYQVVVVGGKNLAKRYRNKDYMFFIDYVENTTLEYLYKKASILLYPTLNEGFGYPPLEAMKYGTPVVASAIASLTEIYGGDMLYFNPYSLEEIATRVLSIMYDEQLRAEYSRRAKKRYREIIKKQKDDLDDIARLILSPETGRK